ncbi:hypothetical protein CC78DRAFT_619858 [Lojkania enalia]|uniref:Uncharacterized protein n=1 Tax=Lojkania enalia TaxID=147567 RepID=A0A9P4K6B0_9PLEO|nr:hypothetical protein CC78DRAFT_619858 [Didymosphaeria enalia]
MQEENKGQRQGSNRNGGLTISGRTLGGPGGGITFSEQQGQHEGHQQQKGQQADEEQIQAAGSQAKEGNEAEAGIEDDATVIEAQAGAEAQNKQATEEQKAGGNSVLATEQAEQFSEGFGITLDEAGNALNAGGNLGITQGTDGSKSIGGENGVNIAANGEITVAGNETE